MTPMTDFPVFYCSKMAESPSTKYFMFSADFPNLSASGLARKMLMIAMARAAIGLSAEGRGCRQTNFICL
jgi:hypothetical protein